MVRMPIRGDSAKDSAVKRSPHSSLITLRWTRA
jgi:hypothetical protein